MKLRIGDETEMVTLGDALARACTSGAVIYLRGELGVGKTTLTRGFLRGFGYEGAVKSPTYTLLESYEIAARRLFHLDLYRLNHPEELAYTGLRESVDGDALLVVEWPERGAGHLPAADIVLDIRYAGAGRVVEISAHSKRGAALCRTLESAGFSPA